MELSQINADGIVMYERLVKNVLKTINTCIVAEIFEFDAEKQRATVRPCIKEKEILSQGRTLIVSLPQIFDVPVFFPFSGQSGFSITYPVKKGDYCLVVFCQRDIYNWKVYGGEQTTNEHEQGTQRMFDLNDAIAFVGFSPIPFAIKDFKNDAIEIRNTDRGVRVRVQQELIELQTKDCNVTNSEGNLSITAGANTFKLNKDAGAEINVAGNIFLLDKSSSTITVGSNVLKLDASGASLTSPVIRLDGQVGCSNGATGSLNAKTIGTVVNGIVVDIQE